MKELNTKPVDNPTAHLIHHLEALLGQLKLDTVIVDTNLTSIEEQVRRDLNSDKVTSRIRKVLL